MKDIEIIIIEKLNSIRTNFRHNKICFSKVESSFVDKEAGDWKKNILLSIILAEHTLKEMDSDLEMISEIIIDVIILNECDIMDITMDISYRNGIMIKEVILKDAVNNDQLTNELDRLFFNSIETHLYESLELLIPFK